MALAPGLRFQILLMLAGLAAASTFLSSIIAVAVLDRAEAAHQEAASETLVASAAVLITSRCEPADIDCASSAVENLKAPGAAAVTLVSRAPATPADALALGDAKLPAAPADATHSSEAPTSPPDTTPPAAAPASTPPGATAPAAARDTSPASTPPGATAPAVATPIPGTSFALLQGPAREQTSIQARKLLLLFAGLNFAILFVLGGLAMLRGVVRPVEALAAQVERVGRLEFGEEPGGHQLGRLGTSFRRMVAALSGERERVERQIKELEEANASLKEARDGLVRSEKLATVGRLSAGLAHEIGNPLGGLIGYLELLKTRLAGDEASRELVSGALASSQRIDRAIRDLLDFARPHDTEPGPFDPRRSIDEAARLVEPRLGEVELEVDAPSGVGPALGDRGGLVQVLVNLVLNAVDAMEGKGRVHLRMQREDERVILTVTDEGPGIPPGSEEEIFEPFFTTKESGRGTGLGLAISRRIVESWGGRLEAASAEEGASFRVVLDPAPAPE